MTEEEFLAEVEKIDGWFLDGRKIRCFRDTNDYQCCPIGKVYEQLNEGKFYGNYSWEEASVNLGLDRNFAGDVVFAADYDLPDDLLRPKLLKACGLEEKK